ncbi:hypothetical protein FNW02_00830 [Komarekiella sp. 'clone 1']|jgi:hypothetical protein|uniref:Uncharacterized protein n=1 Tax=Komarekiella delphini-convector SJRDD-AB1 TaxID=2593771 RepID=A0AA40ST31_9NOST|nr:hypothetical protein [Komarekiella delphini-convector]MBD6614455.1 hypothetical protein [Komarekiella delphini-convector SJRDD-AB1]MBW4688251.1 hypothetical protein [Komarekiella atlantica HA4396-MV6]
MANITLSELHNAGSQLFQDSESFLNDLSDVDTISGGYDNFSKFYGFDKLIEGYVNVYAIGHVTYLAKSFSSNDYSAY